MKLVSCKKRSMDNQASDFCKGHKSVAICIPHADTTPRHEIYAEGFWNHIPAMSYHTRTIHDVSGADIPYAKLLESRSQGRFVLPCHACFTAGTQGIQPVDVEFFRISTVAGSWPTAWAPGPLVWVGPEGEISSASARPSQRDRRT